MDYENTDISKTLKKHMASNVKTTKIVLMVSVGAFGKNPKYFWNSIF